MPNRSFCAGLAAALITLAACADSTTPHGVSPAQLARHFDSLSVTADSGQFGGAVRSQILGAVELAPALGASPVSVTVTTPSGTSAWQGFLYEFGPGSIMGDPPNDTGFSVVAYSDYNLTHVIWANVFYEGNQVYQGVDMVAGDTVVQGGGSGTITAARTTMGGPCVVATGYQNPFAHFGANCSLATFQGSVDWDVLLVGHVSIALQPFNGVDLK
jgi:hypothetical protein